MKIDKGTPIEYDKEGSIRRVEKLEKIHPINFNNVIDYGAGKGAYSLLLSEKTRNLISVDINKSFLNDLNKRKKDNNHLVVTNAESTSFKDNSFDALVAIEVLEHLNNLQPAIKEIKRITRDDGIVFITVPNKYFPLETHHVYLFNKRVDGRFIPFLSMFDSIHKKIGSARRFSVNSLSALFVKEGFSLIGHDYMMLPFDNFRWGSRYLKPLTDRLENSPLKVFSPNIALVFRNLK